MLFLKCLLTYHQNSGERREVDLGLPGEEGEADDDDGADADGHHDLESILGVRKLRTKIQKDHVYVGIGFYVFCQVYFDNLGTWFK
jgi:hypothetical protein